MKTQSEGYLIFKVDVKVKNCKSAYLLNPKGMLSTSYLEKLWVKCIGL